MIFTVSDNNNSNKIKSILSHIAAAAFWLCVWQGLSLAVGTDILLPSPFGVVKRFFSILSETELLSSVWFSFARIVSGFLLATALAVILAVLSYCSKLVSILLHPLVVTIKSVPVASFVVIALIWIPSKNLSIFIAFLMVLPIVYTNVLSGLSATDRKMLEMAKVFKLSKPKRALYIYLPQVFSYFRTGCAVGLGLCWKAGVAAELIGLPKGSLGENLYYSKVYLQTADLFAWTVVIVLISFGFEKLFLYLLDALVKRFERM